MKNGALLGAMPANVLLSARAIVIAGFANDVEAVNQYAAPIQVATRHAASLGFSEPITTRIKPAVARPRTAIAPDPSACDGGLYDR
jgi:hypothetical protein